MNLFFSILNMSITGSLVAVLLLIIRYIFTKSKIPKKFNYVMWSVLIFRLTIPISAMSAFSMFNLAQTKSSAIIPIKDNIAQIKFIEGMTKVDNVIYSNSFCSTVLKWCAFIWCLVVVILMLTFIFSFAIAKYKLQTSFIVKDNLIFEKCKDRLMENRVGL